MDGVLVILCKWRCMHKQDCTHLELEVLPAIRGRAAVVARHICGCISFTHVFIEANVDFQVAS